MTAAAPPGRWTVYMLRCADDSFYVGAATDVARRLRQHNGELIGGARYTRTRRPVQLVWRENCDNRGAAQQREAALKQLSRHEKQALAQLPPGH